MMARVDRCELYLYPVKMGGWGGGGTAFYGVPNLVSFYNISGSPL